MSLRSSVSLFLVILGFCSAQEPPVTGATSPLVLPVPNRDSGETEPQTPKRELKVDPEKIAVPEGDFVTEANITALEAAKLFEKASGKRAIVSKALAEAKDTYSFTLGGPLTNAELAKFLQHTLLAEGIAIIPVPGEPRIVRLVPSGPITSHGSRTFSPRFFDEANLPHEDEIVMFVMRFENIKPEEALKVFQAALGQKAPSGTITAVPSATSLIVVEKASFIRKMLKIKKAIDASISDGETWVTVERGDVEKIAERVKKVYDARGFAHQKSQKIESRPGSQAGDKKSIEKIPLRIVGVPRTSRILLVGRKADLIAAISMIKSLDQTADDSGEK